MSIENIKLRFGIHKGKQIKDVPDEYLKFLLSRDILKGKLLYYCQVKFNLPKNKYEVIVEDAVIGDGTYTVEAYNNTHAINVCKKKNKIQCTQSYHGTIFSVKMIN